MAAFPIKGETIITVMVVVAVLVIGFIVAGFITDLSPEITPAYRRSFDAGSTPFTYGTGQTDLAEIVVTMYNYSASAWDTIESTHVSYAGSTVTVADAGVNTTNHNTTTIISAVYEVNISDLWTKIAGVIGFVIVIALLFYIFKALPKK